MQDLLNSLGLISLDDFTTRIDENIFEKIDINIIQNTLKVYSLKEDNLLNTEESKFQNINRILMLKHERVIDIIKNFDDDGIGFKLEMLIGGFQE